MGFKLLVRDAGSGYGARLSEILEEFPYRVLVPEDQELNWSDRAEVTDYFSGQSPSLVLSFYSTDNAGSVIDDMDELSILVDECIAREIPIIQLSSYHVFGDDQSAEKLAEEEVPTPLKNSIGDHLFNIESIVSQARAHIILRPSWLLDMAPGHVLDVLIPKLINKSDFLASDHNFGCPVSSQIILNVLVALIQQVLCESENWGVFHLRSSDVCSEAELVDRLVRTLQSEAELDVEMPEVANVENDARIFSGNANLLGQRLTSDFGIQLQPWRSGFTSLVKEWLEANKLPASEA